jgi:hypothetical protein
VSTELERQLEAAFAETPDPDPGAGEKALHRALRALQPAAPTRRGLRTAVLAFAAAAVLLVLAAGSLGAAGALHVSFGTQPEQVPLTSGLVLPRGVDGISAVVYGRLSATTTSGFDLQGLPVTAAALSPHGLYVAAGIGRAIVALAPSGRRAWSHPLGAGCPRSDHVCGTVASIAWAPDGLRLAYVVRTDTRKSVLHVIWGNGTHDSVVDRNAQGITPSWRADSLAVAYVGAGGRPIVYDLGRGSHRLIEWEEARPTVHVAFAPRGTDLALGTENSALLVREHHHEVLYRGPTQGVDWLESQLVVSGPDNQPWGAPGRLYRVTPSGTTLLRKVRLPGPVLATDGQMLAVVRHQQLLAGSLDSLHPVLRFRLKPCQGGPFAAYICQVPISSRDVDLG